MGAVQVGGPHRARVMTEEIARHDALDVAAVDGFDALGVHAVVTTRSGGVSIGPYASLNLGGQVGDDPNSVAENRARLAAQMGVAPDALVIANQVHGAAVAVVRRGDEPGDVDVLLTTDPSIALCVLVADCVPAVLVDPIAGVLAVAHAGWRGVAAATMRAAIEGARTLGAEPARCYAYLGPCISPRGYEVGEEVARAFAAVGCGDDVVADGPGRYRADLAAACRRQLLACGVPTRHVTTSSSSTDGGQLFFSDRARRPCGRFAIASRLEGRS
jgi:YfiH family protein